MIDDAPAFISSNEAGRIVIAIMGDKIDVNSRDKMSLICTT